MFVRNCSWVSCKFWGRTYTKGPVPPCCTKVAIAPLPSPFWPALTLPHRQLTQHDQERIWQQQQRRLQKAALWTILKIVLDSCRGRISATASDCEMHGGCVFWVECTHTHISFCGYRSSPAVSCDVWLRRGSTFTSILRGVTFCVQARYTKGVCVCIGI